MAVITVSRQFGSGGDEIAAQAGELLGYRLFSKELMVQVAAEMGLATGGIYDFSEDRYEVRSFLDRLLGTPFVITQLEAIQRDRPGALITMVEKLDEVESINLVQKVIQAVYEHGNMVIVGRGGQAILKDKPGVLHVRINAPLDKRVERLCRRANFSLGGAQDKAIKHDRAAADYLKRFYNVDWADPLLYDLILNTGTLPPATAARLIAAAAQSLPD